MENNNIEKLIKTPYPIKFCRIDEENGDSYFFAYCPDFGHSACSATGETIDEAFKELELVKADVIRHFIETGRKLPKATTKFIRNSFVEKGDM